MTETLSSQSWSNFFGKDDLLNGEGFAETVRLTSLVVAKLTDGETSSVRYAESRSLYDLDFRRTSLLPWRILLFISGFCSVQNFLL